MTLTETFEETLPLPDVRRQEPAGRGRHVRLRPVDRRDIPFLYRIATDGETASRWRYRGATPDPQKFAAQLWDGVLAQFIIERSSDGQPMGLVCAYNVNLRDGYVYVAGVCDTPAVGTGVGVEAMLLLVDHVLANWAVRKVYFESAAFNYEQFAWGATRFFDEEARLRDHTFHQGRYWDLVIGSVTREAHEQNRTLDALRADPVRGDSLADESLLGLEDFCTIVAEALDLDPGVVRPDCRFREDLGVDSLGALILQDLVEGHAGVTDFDLSEGLGTVRETYLRYLTAASTPSPLAGAINLTR